MYLKNKNITNLPIYQYKISTVNPQNIETINKKKKKSKKKAKAKRSKSKKKQKQIALVMIVDRYNNKK